MSWRRSTLQELANPGSEFTWASFAFAGNDPLQAALEPGYFGWWADRLRPGDLILWGCNPDRSGRTAVGAPVAIHRALLMVTAVEGRATRVRLLQDWGGVDGWGPG
jgi:hypothetical protein